MRKKFLSLLVLSLFCGFVAVASAKSETDLPLDDDATSNCKSLGTTSAQFTLPVAGEIYCVSAQGNTAYILCGSNPTATTSVGGYSFFVTSGDTKCRVLTGPKCAYIAASAAGSVCFERITQNP